MLLNIRHSGRVISNIERALHFYVDILGLHEITRGQLDQDEVYKLLQIGDCGLTYIKLATTKDRPELSGGLVELYYLENDELRKEFFAPPFIDEEMESTPLDHIAFSVDNIQALHKKLIENRIEILSSPSIDTSCQFKIFFARDPDCNLLEFVQIL